MDEESQHETAGEPAAATPDRNVVQVAIALQRRIDAAWAEMDPSWRQLACRRWPFVEHFAVARRERWTSRLLLLGHGPVPPAPRLLAPEARLGLLSRDAQRRSLCLLAVARRPGLLRCCLERQARSSLREMLGAAYDRLVPLAQGGGGIGAEAASWSPLHWACVGFFDWAKLTRAEDRLLLRLVRLSLPDRLLGMQVRRQQAPGQVTRADALKALREVDVEWPC